MTKTILLTMTFLACTAWMAAQQSSPSSGYPASSGGSAGQTNGQSGTQTTGQTGSENGQRSPSSGHMNGSGHTTLRGCLSSSGGGYTLTDASGAEYLLTGDTSKLSEDVNKEVEVKGSTAASGEYGSSASTASQSATGTAGAGSSNQMFNVSKVKKISNNCSTGANNNGGMKR